MTVLQIRARRQAHESGQRLDRGGTVDYSDEEDRGQPRGSVAESAGTDSVPARGSARALLSISAPVAAREVSGEARS